VLRELRTCVYDCDLLLTHRSPIQSQTPSLPVGLLHHRITQQTQRPPPAAGAGGAGQGGAGVRGTDSVLTPRRTPSATLDPTRGQEQNQCPPPCRTPPPCQDSPLLVGLLLLVRLLLPLLAETGDTLLILDCATAERRGRSCSWKRMAGMGLAVQTVL
jgi:hypothetical protein